MKDNDNHYLKTYGKYSWKPNIFTIFANKKAHIDYEPMTILFIL